MKNFGSLIVLLILVLLITIYPKSIQQDINNTVHQQVDLTYNHYPAEFEKQQAVWMMWPPELYNSNGYSVNTAVIKIIHTLTPFIRVNIMCENKYEIEQIKAMLKTNGYSIKNVYFYIIRHQTIWARDVGPIFVKDGHNRLSVVDFGFNNYSRGGNEYFINNEGQVDKLTAQALQIPAVKTSLISEGGAIESNGRGTMMVTESVALRRNPGMTKSEIEKEYKRTLGIKKIVWLDKGLAEEDAITGGHIDEMARFANPHTILLAQVLPSERYTNKISEESYLRLETNYRILKNATDQDGKHFRIIRIPMPPGLYAEIKNMNDIPVRSYLNYLVANKVILIPSYWKPERSSHLKKTEAQVISIFQKTFPGRKVIGIDAENINNWGGGIHCITQSMPAI